MRILTIVATVAAVAAVAAASAAAGTTAFRVCAPTSIGGKPWVIVTLGVPCSSATTLVRRLAGSPGPAGRIYPGTYEGMKCLSVPVRVGHSLTCLSRDAQRQVRASERR